MQNNLMPIFEAQKQHCFTLRQSTAKDRIEKLKRLKKAIAKFETSLLEALHKDLRKCEFEAQITEIRFTYAEIDFAIKNVSKWIRPKRIGKTLANPFSKNRIVYEPKGICLIVSPWNYPFQLAIGPLVSAIAAGNCCIVKPSEISAHTSLVIQQIISNCFEEKEVACILGDVAVAQDLLALPFDHIFFTGSTNVGKKVMSAAAQNLSSVTLELGGKSPVIVDETADLEDAAVKIAWGKLTNAGQTCIAPDYILVAQNVADAFAGHYKNAVKRLYGLPGGIDKSVYGAIINTQNFNRLKKLMDDAVAQGARINFGGNADEKTLTFYPTLMSKVPLHSNLMQEEIFGPILPLIPFTTADEALSIINSKPKPLALYMFSRSKSAIKHVITQTSAGSTCINDVLIQIANPKLPFGGVNHSGMGASHGFFGFKSFSHERSVTYQSKINFNNLAYPPYIGKQWVLNLLKRIM